MRGNVFFSEKTPMSDSHGGIKVKGRIGCRQACEASEASLAEPRRAERDAGPKAREKKSIFLKISIAGLPPIAGHPIAGARLRLKL